MCVVVIYCNSIWNIIGIFSFFSFFVHQFVHMEEIRTSEELQEKYIRERRRCKELEGLISRLKVCEGTIVSSLSLQSFTFVVFFFETSTFLKHTLDSGCLLNDLIVSYQQGIVSANQISNTI